VRFLVLALIAFLVFAASLFLAPRPINPASMSGIERDIILSIRLPRIVVAVLMGMGLGASGAVLQGMFRNPLADPYILGLSSGATLMAATGLILGITVFGAFTVPVFAFVGALVAGVFVGLMGYRRGIMLPERLLLAGIGAGFLFTAVMRIIMSISASEGVKRAILWIYGDLSLADWSLIPYGAIFIALGLIVAIRRARALNTLMLGDDLAHSLGFSPRKETLILFISVGLMTAASVSLGGMVVFIGLLMPHIMRFFVGPDNRVLIPSSALGGGVLLVVADLIGRTVHQPVEFPAGVVTAVIGAPYFLYLLRRRDVLGI
jgi:iron complex transport system permease protein